MNLDSKCLAAKRVLRHALATIPYSSAAPFHLFFPPWHDATHRPSLGHACAWQSLYAARALGTEFDDVRLLRDGRHLSAVISFPSALIVLDPYLLQLDPMVVPLDEGDVTVDVDALPYRQVHGRRRASQLRGRYYADSSTLTLQHRVVDPNNGRRIVRRHFEFDLNGPGLHPQDDPPVDLVTPLLLHPEQDNVSIRAVDLEALETYELVIPYDDSGQSGLVHHALRARNSDGNEFVYGSESFDQIADRAAELVAVDRAILEDHLISAVLTQRNLRAVCTNTESRTSPVRVFLSGTMQGASESGDVRDQDYRPTLAQALTTRYPEVEVVDPFVYLVERLAASEEALRLEHNELASAQQPQPRKPDHGFHPVLNVFDHQVAMARQSDVCLAFMPGNEPSLGTAMEMRAAFEAGAAVVAITGLTSHLAVLASSHRVVRTLDDFLRGLDTGQFDEFFVGRRQRLAIP